MRREDRVVFRVRVAARTLLLVVYHGFAVTVVAWVVITLACAVQVRSTTPVAVAVLVLPLPIVAHLVWALWRLGRQVLRSGGVRLAVDGEAVSLTVEGTTTRITWEQVEWAAARVGIPPDRRKVMLVARLGPGAPRPPRGGRFWPPWYELRPQWYAARSVVRVVDMTLLDAPVPEVIAVLNRFAGEKWRSGRAFLASNT